MILIKGKTQRENIACMFIAKLPKLFYRIYTLWSTNDTRQFYIGFKINPEYIINIYFNEDKVFYEFQDKEGYNINTGGIKYKTTNSETIKELISIIIKWKGAYEKGMGIQKSSC